MKKLFWATRGWTRY